MVREVGLLEASMQKWARGLPATLWSCPADAGVSPPCLPGQSEQAHCLLGFPQHKGCPLGHAFPSDPWGPDGAWSRVSGQTGKRPARWMVSGRGSSLKNIHTSLLVGIKAKGLWVNSFDRDPEPPHAPLRVAAGTTETPGAFLVQPTLGTGSRRAGPAPGLSG